MSDRARTTGEYFWNGDEGGQTLHRCQALLNTISDGIYQLDAEGRFVAVDDGILELTGYTRNDLLGKHVSVLLDDSDIDAIEDVIYDRLETDVSATSWEITIETADGDRIPCKLHMNSLVTDDAFEGTVGAVQDISEYKEDQRKLRESNERYRALVENFPKGTVNMYDEDLRYRAVGGQLLDALEIDPDDRIGHRITELYPDDVVEEVEPYFEAALEGEVNAFELEFRGRHLQAHTLPVRNADDEVDAGMLVVQDITDRKADQRKLEESERRYRTLVENFPNGAVALVDADLQYRTVGGRTRDVADVTVEEVEGKPVGEAVPPELADELVPRYEAAFEGNASTFQAESNGRVYQFQIVPVRDDDGDVFAALGMSQDVTEREEAQRKLAESEQRYRTLVENFPNGAVGLYNEDLEYTAVGGQLMDATGVKREDRIGSSVYEIYPDEIVDAVESYFHAAFDGEANSFEEEFHNRHLLAHTLPVRDADDEIIAGMLVVQDVTEQREYERKLEASNERLEQFAHAASHDLQEPLRMVSSYLQLLEKRYSDDFDADGEEFLEFAVDGADRMREMITGLLEYSRVETEGDPLEPVDLNAVLADVRVDLAMRIEESDAEITAEELPQVEGDGSQLRQVFQNLLDNAMEYSGDEPPQVHVAAERDGDWWTVSVSDEGIGFDSMHADQVFEVFESLHTQEEYSGTGIGLALCERIIERHGGEIWVETEPDNGATFSFTLPAIGAGESSN